MNETLELSNQTQKVLEEPTGECWACQTGYPEEWLEHILSLAHRQKVKDIYYSHQRVLGKAKDLGEAPEPVLSDNESSVGKSKGKRGRKPKNQA